MKVKLTDLETDVLWACYYNEYHQRGSGQCPAVWSFSVTDNCRVAKPEQVSGVVSSLVKKGLLTSDMVDSDQAIEVTPAGHELALELGIDELASL